MLMRLLGPASMAMLAGFILGRARAARQSPSSAVTRVTAKPLRVLDPGPKDGVREAPPAPATLLEDATAKPPSDARLPHLSSREQEPATDTPGLTAEEAAKHEMPIDDPMVWVNTKTRIYHFAGTQSYGRTRYGAYARETDAAAAGNRPSRIERSNEAS